MSCPICLDDEKTDFTNLCCSHKICNECYPEFEVRFNRCPICRTVFREQSTHSYQDFGDDDDVEIHWSGMTIDDDVEIHWSGMTIPLPEAISLPQIYVIRYNATIDENNNVTYQSTDSYLFENTVLSQNSRTSLDDIFSTYFSQIVVNDFSVRSRIPVEYQIQNNRVRNSTGIVRLAELTNLLNEINSLSQHELENQSDRLENWHRNTSPEIGTYFHDEEIYQKQLENALQKEQERKDNYLINRETRRKQKLENKKLKYQLAFESEERKLMMNEDKYFQEVDSDLIEFMIMMRERRQMKIQDFNVIPIVRENQIMEEIREANRIAALNKLSNVKSMKIEKKIKPKAHKLTEAIETFTEKVIDSKQSLRNQLKLERSLERKNKISWNI